MIAATLAPVPVFFRDAQILEARKSAKVGETFPVIRLSTTWAETTEPGDEVICIDKSTDIPFANGYVLFTTKARFGSLNQSMLKGYSSNPEEPLNMTRERLRKTLETRFQKPVRDDTLVTLIAIKVTEIL